MTSIARVRHDDAACGFAAFLTESVLGTTALIRWLRGEAASGMIGARWKHGQDVRGQMMQYTTLATDYDGTIAMAGRVTEATVQALRDAKAAGIRLLMVTGRELDDLYRNFSHCDLFERIVAENGALLHDPGHRTSRTLSPPPPPALLEALTQLKIPFSAGNSIIAADEVHKHAVLEVISRLGIEWHIILNKDSLMILPSDVTKASGLTVALEELAIPAEKVVGVGDAENDQAFLRMCGYSAAVANALPAVKSIADFVSDHPAGEGVTDLLQMWMRDSLPARVSA